MTDQYTMFVRAALTQIPLNFCDEIFGLRPLSTRIHSFLDVFIYAHLLQSFTRRPLMDILYLCNFLHKM